MDIWHRINNAMEPPAYLYVSPLNRMFPKECPLKRNNVLYKFCIVFIMMIFVFCCKWRKKGNENWNENDIVVFVWYADVTREMMINNCLTWRVRYASNLSGPPYCFVMVTILYYFVKFCHYLHRWYTSLHLCFINGNDVTTKQWERWGWGRVEDDARSGRGKGCWCAWTKGWRAENTGVTNGSKPMTSSRI